MSYIFASITLRAAKINMSSDSIKHSSKEPLHAVHISQGLSILRCMENLRKGENAWAARALIKYGNGRLLLMNVTVMTVNQGEAFKVRTDSWFYEPGRFPQCDYRCSNVVLQLKMWTGLHLVLTEKPVLKMFKYLNFLYFYFHYFFGCLQGDGSTFSWGQ